VQCWRRDKEQYAGFSNKLIISWSKKGPFWKSGKLGCIGRSWGSGYEHFYLVCLICRINRLHGVMSHEIKVSRPLFDFQLLTLVMMKV
jgi:hypothetical protein